MASKAIQNGIATFFEGNKDISFQHVQLLKQNLQHHLELTFPAERLQMAIVVSVNYMGVTVDVPAQNCMEEITLRIDAKVRELATSCGKTPRDPGQPGCPLVPLFF